MDDLRSRITNRVQLTTDGHKAYLNAVEETFGTDVDYAMLVKLYGDAPGSAKGRYSPAECTGAIKTPIGGAPDPKHVSTGYAERQKPHHADGDAPLHPPDQGILQKVGKPRPHGRALHRLVQLGSHPQDAARDAGHGGKVDRSAHGSRRSLP